MHYYPHHIGDHDRDTASLSLMEQGAYVKLMWSYYATERPLPESGEGLCRICGAMTKAEREAVMNVVARYFVSRKEPGLWHKRIDREIAQYKARGEASRSNGLKGGRPRKPPRGPCGT